MRPWCASTGRRCLSITLPRTCSAPRRCYNRGPERTDLNGCVDGQEYTAKVDYEDSNFGASMTSGAEHVLKVNALTTAGGIAESGLVFNRGGRDHGARYRRSRHHNLPSSGENTHEAELSRVQLPTTNPDGSSTFRIEGQNLGPTDGSGRFEVTLGSGANQFNDLDCWANVTGAECKNCLVECVSPRAGVGAGLEIALRVKGALHAAIHDPACPYAPMANFAPPQIDEVEGLGAMNG